MTDKEVVVLSERYPADLQQGIDRYLRLGAGWEVLSFSTAYGGAVSDMNSYSSIKKHIVMYSAMLVRREDT